MKLLLAGLATAAAIAIAPVALACADHQSGGGRGAQKECCKPDAATGAQKECCKPPAGQGRAHAHPPAAVQEHRHTEIRIETHGHPSEAAPLSLANKALVTAMAEEVFNRKTMSAIDRYFAPSYIERSAMAGTKGDLSGFKTMVTVSHKAFPDLRMQLKSLVSEGDVVVARTVLSGTHKGAMMGMKPTGKRFEIEGLHWFRLQNGKIVEHWGHDQESLMMKQLGLDHEAPHAAPARPLRR